MQGIQNYEDMLYAAFFEDTAEARWNIFFTMVQQLYTEIQEQGRSSFYERCLSCYHNGITPANVKIPRAGWFSRNALNIVFGVNYLLMGQNPSQLQSVMTTQFGSLNNLLRDSHAQQDVRYAVIFRDAQKHYEEFRMRYFVSGSPKSASKQNGQLVHTAEAQTDEKKESLATPVKEDTASTVLDNRENLPVSSISEQTDLHTESTGKETLESENGPSESTENGLSDNMTVAKFTETATEETLEHNAPVTREEQLVSIPSEEPKQETDTPASESIDAIPALLLPVLAENQNALSDAIRAQKQLHEEISNLISSLNNPFSRGAMFQRQLLSSLDGLIAYQEECNRILLSNLSNMESALCATQWQGFVEIAALLDAFFDDYRDPEARRPNAMWGDIRAIRQKYTNQLRRQGIDPIVPQPGDTFDEELHELSDDSEVDIDNAARITALHTCGYRMENTVFLRAVVDADETVPDR